ncbi:hybrid sensor histidine kinase/response regulator transcription factor [Spirosoma gilvum]
MLLFCLLLPFALLAQPANRANKGWQELTISQGLSQGMVFDIKQDHNGFVWIATKDGLNRYDGHNVWIFTHDPYNPFSLSDNVCTALLIDRQQRLWIGTEKQGLNLFDGRTERFYHITLSDGAEASINNPEITSLTEAPDGAIWVCAHKNQAFRITLLPNFEPKRANSPDLTAQVQVQHLPVLRDRPRARPMALSFAPDGTAWFSTFYGLFALNHRQPNRVTQLAEHPILPLDLASMLVVAPRGYWITTNQNRIVCWHRGQTKLISLPPENPGFLTLSWLDANTVAIGNANYLWLLSPDELERQDRLSAQNAYARMSSDLYGVTTLLRDKTGLLWLGTAGYGVRWFNPQVKRFESSLPSVSLSNLLQDRRGRIYVRYVDHIRELDPTTGQLRRFLPPLIDALSLRNLIQDRQGVFWLTLSNARLQKHQLLKFSEDWQLLQTYPLPPNGELGFASNRTLEDRAGNIWIGTINGKLLRFEPRTGTFRVLTYDYLLHKQGSDVETYALFQDRADNIWIGTQQGLIRVKNPNGKPACAIYRNDVNDRNSLSDNYVSTLADDPNEPNRFLWVGTKGGGLNRLNRQTLTDNSAQFDHVGEREGLPNKVVYGLLPDSLGNLWLSTNRGIAQFNPKNRMFRPFTKTDGLQDDEFNTNSFVIGSAGRLLFGGVNGLTVFRPADFRQSNTTRPVAHIISLRINNKPVAVGEEDGLLDAPIEQTQQLDLAYDQNLVTLEFGVMDFANPAGNRYRYKMEGIDQDWVNAGTNRFANYAQLPDGTYTLQMMGSANGDVWSKPVTLHICVHPPFYRTWWAYLFYLLVVAVVGWQLYRFQWQRAILQQKVVFEQAQSLRLAELDAMKTQFFANISHEFRTPLTLILGPLADLKQRFPSESVLSMMERNASRLLSLINQLLDLSKLEANQLTPEPTNGDLAAFLRTVTSSFESLAKSLAIQFAFSQDKSVYWASFDRDKLEKIINNLLSNAFKFTPTHQSVQMTAQYQEDPDRVVIKVQDTGIGIAPNHLAHIFERFYQVDGNTNRPYEGTGIGLALVNELVNVLGGTITVASTEVVGTSFQVTLPLIPVSPTEPEPFTNNLPLDVRTEGRAIGPAPEAANETRIVGKAVVTQATGEDVLLIVDDNADIRAYVRSIFETDYQIVDAEDGQDGFEKATALLPNVVICDLMMPRLDGFGFCRALKTQEATSHIPVIMLTAKATVEDRIEGFELGADEYLTKPFNRQELQTRVRNLLDKQERLRSYFRHQSVSAPTVLPIEVAVPALSREDIFLQKARQVLEAHYSNSQFGVDEFSAAMNLSPSQLLRKLRALTTLTTVEYLRRYRLERAAYWLATRSVSVSEVAYQVGFESLPYFTKVFQEQYGAPPSEYGATPASRSDS